MNITYLNRKTALFTLILFLFTVSLIPTITSTNDESIWITFIQGATPGSTSEILPKSSDTMGLCVDSNFLGMYSITTIINETRYNVLNIPNAGHVSTIGEPAVPMITRFVEIPDGVEASFEVIYSDMQVLEGYNVIPVRESAMDLANASEPPFIIDKSLYQTDAFYPLNIVSLEGVDGQDPIILRGHRLVALTLYPVQFNPVTQQLRVYSKIEVRINYDEPAQVGPLDPRLLSPVFEELLESFVLNYQPRPLTMDKFVPMLWAYSPSMSSTDIDSPDDGITGVDYLIITHDDFYREIRELAFWKNRKGLRTMIVNTSQIGVNPTADDIADYIKDAYDTWSPAPSYVLLVGDSEFIPPHYETQHPSPSHGPAATPGLIGTDLYYATVHGTDYFPDIYIGRLSVDTTAQTTTIVDKILEYEQNPPDAVAQADFYTSATSSAMFQDDNLDGFEDRRFVLTCEEIRDHLLAEGYAVDRIYFADPGTIFPPTPAVNPTNYNNGDYANGAAIPAALLRVNGFLWDGDAVDVRNSFIDGRFLIYHRDHGLSRNFWNHRPAVNDGQWWGNFDGWGDPFFSQANIAGLNNGDLLPVVLSIECQSGWFDGEVDQDYQLAAAPTLNYTRSFESFCEELVRRQNGGAIATIGATRNSYSGYNDQLVRGFIDAVWPDFDTDYASGGLYELGQVLTYGKIYMAHKHAYDTSIVYWGNLVKETFELFHLFGDPELSMWTDPPGELGVSHPEEMGSQGWQSLVVNVTDQGTGDTVHYAKVCLWKDVEVYSVAYTDPDGGAYFTVNPTSGGDMNITVTKHNYRPYVETITITSGGATLTVTPDSGPAGSNPSFQGDGFDGGEFVDVYYGGTMADDTVRATAGSFTETVTVPAGPVGPINVRAMGQSSGRVAVTVFRRLPDQPLPDPYTYCQWDASTWTLNPTGGDPRWNNPEIVLYEKSTGNQVASNDLRVGTTYTVKADIHNAGTVSATDTEVTIEWGDWGAGQRVWNMIGKDTVTVPSGGVSTAEADWTPSVTGHTCLMVTIYHAWDENLDNNRGQENTDVHPVSSPGEITFSIGNPTEKTALVYLDAKQVGGPDLWPAIIQREYPQVQEPGDVLNGTLVVEAPMDSELGEMRVYTVSAYIEGELIGGVEIYVVVKTPTSISCQVSSPQVSLGDTVTASGSITPGVEGATVILTYEGPDGVTLDRIVTTDSTNSYSDSYQPDTIGSWSVTASWRGDNTHMESSSQARQFEVEPMKPCQIIQLLVLAIIVLILYYIRNRSKEIKIIGAIVIIILVLMYYWYCVW